MTADLVLSSSSLLAFGSISLRSPDAANSYTSVTYGAKKRKKEEREKEIDKWIYKERERVRENKEYGRKKASWMQHGGQWERRVHLDDVKSANKVAVDVELRVGWPVAELLEPLPHLPTKTSSE